MSKIADAKAVGKVIADAKQIVIVQPDNPDTDSLASALALEQILGQLGKDIRLYAGVDLPSYLHYLPGFDHLEKELPKQFDASIIVDTTSLSLLEQLEQSGQLNWLAAKPSIILDHHATDSTIKFAKVIYNPPAVATGEVIYELADQLNWPINLEAAKLLAVAILSDSLGLVSADTTARSVHVVGELVERGVSLAELENTRRDNLRREPELIHYKGRLLQRVEFYDDNRLAVVTIPWEEIEQFSPLYNPSMLVLDDMRLGKGTDLAMAFKLYPGGKVTAKLRANYGYPVADKLAEHFGGGGHAYAAGFKLSDGRSAEDIKTEAIAKAAELLAAVDKAKS